MGLLWELNEIIQVNYIKLLGPDTKEALNKHLQLFPVFREFIKTHTRTHAHTDSSFKSNLVSLGSKLLWVAGCGGIYL